MNEVTQTPIKNFTKGIFSENPLFISMLGLCPALAVTSSLEGALGMSMAVVFVLFFSNLIISLIRKIVPNEIRIPVYIVIIATLVTVVEMTMAAYFPPSINNKLGIFISLIVVNCMILGRAESYASKNGPLASMIDALGMAVGFAVALILIASLREVLGEGTLTFWTGIEKKYLIDFTKVYEMIRMEPTTFFTSSPGAFLVLGLLVGCINAIVFRIKDLRKKRAEVSK